MKCFQPLDESHRLLDRVSDKSDRVSGSRGSPTPKLWSMVKCCSGLCHSEAEITRKIFLLRAKVASDSPQTSCVLYCACQCAKPSLLGYSSCHHICETRTNLNIMPRSGPSTPFLPCKIKHEFRSR